MTDTEKSYIGAAALEAIEADDETKPMSHSDRMRLRINKSLLISLSKKTNNDIEIGKKKTILGRFKNGSGASLLIKYLNWSFQTSFSLYFLSAFAIFILHAQIFALLMSITRELKCVTAIHSDFTYFERLTASFTLSWTTFSTVGYGQIYPSIHKDCVNINLLCMVCSFVGVLYAGFCGAILFGKVSIIYSRAMVIFSSGCVLRYGDGVDDDDDDERFDRQEAIDTSDHKTSDSDSINESENAPFPFLSFRIVNQLANHPSGSIMNASLNVVGVIESRKQNKKCTIQNKDVNNKEAINRRHFRSLPIEPDKVSHFDQVLYIRHILNKDSALLTPETRKMIRKNNGKWPNSINTTEQLYSCLEFEQIHVSLEGISDVSKATVYAKKTYEMEDIKIGWKFIDMLYKSPGKSKMEVQVDFDLINVIIKQTEGEEVLMERIKNRKNVNLNHKKSTKNSAV